MIRPPSATCCAACERTRKVPRRFVAMTLSKVSTSPLAMGDRGMMPALLTTTSICPKALRVFSKSCLTSSGLATSAWMARARPPLLVISLTTSSALAALPAKLTTTPNPSAARRRAMARPIPRDAPVTIAVFLMMVLLFLAASSNLKSAKERLNLRWLSVQCIVLIFIMRVTQLRQADLNLLVVFSVLAEERNVSRAAKRLLLSQPSGSRALQRMRDTFHDDLLVRTAKGYEPTPQGERVLQELEIMLPKLDRLISGSTFDPVTEHCSFRIAATDNATSIIAPVLCRDGLPVARPGGF